MLVVISHYCCYSSIGERLTVIAFPEFLVTLCSTQAAFNNMLTSAFGGWWLVVGGWWLVVGGWWLVMIRVLLYVCLSNVYPRLSADHQVLSSHTNQPTSAHSFIYIYFDALFYILRRTN